MGLVLIMLQTVKLFFHQAPLLFLTQQQVK